MLKPFALAAALLLPAGVALADEMERVPPVTDPQVLAECGACHMAFQPAFLPAAGWRAIMADLPNHFGEDASLPEATRQPIETWLVAHAGRGTGAPTRITELRWWVREHDHEVSPRQWDKAGSKANCGACHRGAAQGWYEDD